MQGGNFGGVEVYQETIVEVLRRKYDILFYRPASVAISGGNRHYVLTDDRHSILKEFSVPEFDVWNTLTHPASEATLSYILTDYNIDLVHFQNLINHCASLPIICRLLGVPTVYTLQDFWTVCTRFNLIDHRGAYCEVGKLAKEICDVCMNVAQGIQPGAQGYRRNFFSHVLSAFSRVMGNSATTTEICRAIYPELPADRIVQIGLPVPWSMTQAKSDLSKSEVNTLDRGLRVVFLGNFTRIKRAEAFIEAALILKDDGIQFTVCGRIDEQYKDRLRDLALPNVNVEGAFIPGQLDLSRFDIALNLSIWPETYCITLSEAWKAGLVPIVTSCGALLDRVQDGRNDYYVPINGSGELVAILRRLNGNRSELNRVKMNIDSELWLTPKQHCDVLDRVYAELISSHPWLELPASPVVDTGAPSTLELKNWALISPDWTQPDLFVLPPPLNDEPELMSPLREMLPRVLRSFSNGLIECAPPLTVHIDDFGVGVQALTPLIGAVEMGLPASSPQLNGWLQHTEGTPTNLALAIRSIQGDIILRPAYLYHRTDLIEDGSKAGIRVGFLTGAFTLEMLDYGVYGLELIRFRDDNVLEVTPLPSVIVRRKGFVYLSCAQQSPVRMPLPGEAWCNIPQLITPVNEAVDDLDIINYAASGQPPLLALSVQGWIIDCRLSSSNSSNALQLSGDASFHVGLTPVNRPDVLQMFGVEGNPMIGYDGFVWVDGLPSGIYSIELVKRLPDYKVVRKLGQLVIGPAESQARVTLGEVTIRLEDAWSDLPFYPQPMLFHSVEKLDLNDSMPEFGVSSFALKIRGWMLDLHEGDVSQPVAIQIRGEVTIHAILSPVHRRDILKDRNFAGPEMNGYKGTVPLETLTGGSYAVELIKNIGGRIVNVTVAQLLIDGRSGRARLRRYDSVIPGFPWIVGEYQPATILRLALDGISVINVAEEGEPRMAVIQLHGWLFCKEDSEPGASTVLRLSGDQVFYMPLKAVLRPDIVQVLKLSGSEKSGFSGSAWLRGMPPGVYKLELTKLFQRSVAIYFIGWLRVGRDVDDIRVTTGELVADSVNSHDPEFVGGLL